jgi:hypothetical protein
MRPCARLTVLHVGIQGPVRSPSAETTNDPSETKLRRICRAGIGEAPLPESWGQPLGARDSRAHRVLDDGASESFMIALRKRIRFRAVVEPAMALDALRSDLHRNPGRPPLSTASERTGARRRDGQGYAT